MTVHVGNERTSGLLRHARLRNEESLACIRAAASELFTRDGYTAVTMGQLAEEAGVTRQTLYRHFPSKYDLALDFMHRSNADTLNVWSGLRDCDLADKASVREWIQAVISHQIGRKHVRAYVELTSTEPRYRKVLADLIAQIVHALADVHPSFGEADAEPDGLLAAKAHLFVATLMERSDFIALGEEWFARDHLEEIMTDWLMTMIERWAGRPNSFGE